MIYCIEDESTIRDMILYALETVGLQGIGFESGEGLWSRLEVELPDLIILDIMLPGKSGLEILDSLKSESKYKNIPVILLTAKSTDMDIIKGLNTGADDYITKPFNVLELVARIKAVLRRTKKEKVELNFGPISMEQEKRKVMVQGREVFLTYKEYELLLYFLKHPEIVLSREQIVSNIWGFDFEGESRTVDVHVASLRSKLKEGGKLIRTVRNVGYKVSKNI